MIIKSTNKPKEATSMENKSSEGGVFDGFKHLFWSQNPEVLNELRTLLIEQFKKIIANSGLNNERKGLAIKQVLGLLPYAITQHTDEVEIPVLVDQAWNLTTFKVKHIPLLPSLVPSSDQFYAYGLTPKEPDPNTKRILLYKGTTYPTDSGFWTTIMADLFPFSDIGKPIIWFGKNRVKKWLNETADGQVDIYGQSLGGALSLMSHNLPHVVSVTAINPALPSSQGSYVNSTIILNSLDNISRIGVLPNTCTVHEVSLNSELNQPSIWAHVRAWAASPNAEQKTLKEKREKEERRYSTWWILYWIIRPTGFLLLLPIYIVHLVYAYFKDLTQWVVNKISYALLKPELQSEPLQVKASDLKSHGKSYEKILAECLSTTSDKKDRGSSKNKASNSPQN